MITMYEIVHRNLHFILGKLAKTNCDQILENHPYGRAWIFELTTILLTSQKHFKNISHFFL